MKLPRRQFLHLAAGAAALPAMSRIASAQTYPTKPVRWIANTAAGSTVDILCSVSNLSLKIARALEAISAPRRWCALPQTATRSC